MKPTLDIQVFSGLGSRMRAVLGAIAWAKNHGADVRVCWPREDKSETLGEFPAWFSDLFDSPLAELKMPRQIRSGRDWPKYPLRVTDQLFRCRTCDPATLLIDQLDLTGWPYPELWRPSQLVQAQIDAVDWPQGKVVGVHIRHALAQPTTPAIEWFVSRMAEIHLLYRPRAFFLSTDAHEVEHAIKLEFPNVFCQERTYRYDRLGITRAAADLFLLQRCDWMVGSYNSSYSELAGWLRGGQYLTDWGREGWMPGGRYEDSHTPPVGIEEALG